MRYETVQALKDEEFKWSTIQEQPQRILIENIIRILSERYRDRRKRFGLRFNLIAVICNMELKIVC